MSDYLIAVVAFALGCAFALPVGVVVGRLAARGERRLPRPLTYYPSRGALVIAGECRHLEGHT